MYDQEKLKPAQQQRKAPDNLVGFAHRQALGNDASQLGLTALEAEPGYLDLFGGFDVLGGDVSTPNTLSSGPGLPTPDETLSDQLDLLDMPTSVPLEHTLSSGRTAGVELGAGTFGVSTQKVDENEVLGTASARTAGEVDLNAGTLKVGSSVGLKGADGDAGAVGAGYSVQFGKDGQLVVGGSVKSGSTEVQAHIMGDLASDGSLQAVGAGGVVGTEGAKVGLSGAFQFGTVDVKDNTVSRTTGASLSGELEVGPWGASAGGSRSYSETLTFADEAQARAYGAELAAGEHRRVEELGAQDILALPEGARAEYVWKLDGKVGPKMLFKPEGHAGGSQKVSIDKTGGDTIRLTVEAEGRLGGSAGVDNGLLGTEGTYDQIARERQVYAIDLSDPEQAAAFERFQSSGDRSGLQLVEAEAMTGSESTSKAGGFGLASTESDRRLSGNRVDASGVSDVEQGGYTQEGSNSWDVWGTLASAAGSVRDWLGLGSAAHTKADLAAEKERFAASGSANGRNAGQMEVLTQRESGETIAIAETTVDYDDQRENARMLNDLVDHQTDGPDVNPNLLPPHAKTDTAWKLETHVNPAGVQAIEDLLQSDAPLPCESVSAVGTWMEAREAYQGSDGTSADLRRVIADAATEGEDALECAGVIAGDENVEQFLSRGDDVWMSAAEHKRFSDELDVITGSKDSPRHHDRIQAMRKDLERRVRALEKQAASKEVPPEFVDAERRRLNTLLERLENA